MPKLTSIDVDVSAADDGCRVHVGAHWQQGLEALALRRPRQAREHLLRLAATLEIAVGSVRVFRSPRPVCVLPAVFSFAESLALVDAQPGTRRIVHDGCPDHPLFVIERHHAKILVHTDAGVYALSRQALVDALRIAASELMDDVEILPTGSLLVFAIKKLSRAEALLSSTLRPRRALREEHRAAHLGLERSQDRLWERLGDTNDDELPFVSRPRREDVLSANASVVRDRRSEIPALEEVRLLRDLEETWTTIRPTRTYVGMAFTAHDELVLAYERYAEIMDLNDGDYQRVLGAPDTETALALHGTQLFYECGGVRRVVDFDQVCGAETASEECCPNAGVASDADMSLCYDGAPVVAVARDVRGTMIVTDTEGTLRAHWFDAASESGAAPSSAPSSAPVVPANEIPLRELLTGSARWTRVLEGIQSPRGDANPPEPTPVDSLSTPPSTTASTPPPALVDADAPVVLTLDGDAYSPNSLLFACVRGGQWFAGRLHLRSERMELVMWGDESSDVALAFHQSRLLVVSARALRVFPSLGWRPPVIWESTHDLAMGASDAAMRFSVRANAVAYAPYHGARVLLRELHTGRELGFFGGAWAPIEAVHLDRRYGVTVVTTSGPHTFEIHHGEPRALLGVIRGGLAVA